MCRLFVLFQPGILCCDEIIFSSLQGFWLQHRIADTSLLEDAHEHGLSLGKNYVYLELSRYDANVTPANCREMTMTQTRNRMKDCRDGEHESDSQGGNRNGYGSNHHGQGKTVRGKAVANGVAATGTTTAIPLNNIAAADWQQPVKSFLNSKATPHNGARRFGERF